MPQKLENVIVKDKNIIINNQKCKKAIKKANNLMGSKEEF